MSFVLGCAILLLKLSYSASTESLKQPHIIIIYADDQGWNDVSFHGSPQIPTPNIDALALAGTPLQNYYGERLCSPSRAALLTGKYPMRLGLQHMVILGGEATGIPLNETLMPQHLKKLGYETHIIGKWHLGYQNKEYTPTYRGFDTFYGYWNGFVDYYDHTYLETNRVVQPFYGSDWHNDMSPIRDEQGKYATHAFTEKAEEIIWGHNTSKPLFMYLAQLAVHSGNKYQYMQAPSDVVSEFKYIDDLNRRIHAGISRCLDDSVGAVFKALHGRGMLENTIILYLSDNGGEISPKFGGYGSNYPLRGDKNTLWEGATRLPGVIWSPLLKSQISHQFIHVTDWLPTLYAFAGGNLNDLGTIDGIDMSQALKDGTPSNRTDLLQNIDPVVGTSAYRQGHLKLVNGSNPSKPLNYWFGPTGFENFDGPATYEWVFKNGSVVRDILNKMGMWNVKNPDETYRNLRLICEQPPPKEAFQCDPTQKPCLFNITADPCEYNDIADQYPDTVKEMMETINRYGSQQMPPQSKAPDPLANPMCHDFLYVPWLDPDEYRECDFLSEGDSTTTH